MEKSYIIMQNLEKLVVLPIRPYGLSTPLEDKITRKLHNILPLWIQVNITRFFFFTICGVRDRVILLPLPQSSTNPHRWWTDILTCIVQHYIRDRGGIRFLNDNFVVLLAAILCFTHPSLVFRFSTISRSLQCVQYGRDQLEILEIFKGKFSTGSTLLFVHGGESLS